MKIYKIIICILIFTICINVDAIEYKTMQIIPIDTISSVSTETFNYVDFVYHSSIDGDGNSSVSFSYIKNNTTSSMPVSINMLLFDANKKNIGFISYCSDRDISTDNSGFHLEGGNQASFSILVNRKYFSNNKNASNVKYIAVMDDNKYCQESAFGKYYGLTIEEIKGGQIRSNINLPIPLIEAFENYANSSIIIIFIIGGGILTLFLCVGLGLNTLYKKVYNSTTLLAYFPITNTYVAVQLAFGRMLAIIFVGLYAVSIFLLVLGTADYFIAANIIFLLSIVIDLYKLFTNKFKSSKDKEKSFKKVEKKSSTTKKENTDDLLDFYSDEDEHSESKDDDLISNFYSPSDDENTTNNKVFSNDKFISSNVSSESVVTSSDTKFISSNDSSESIATSSDANNLLNNLDITHIKGDNMDEGLDELDDSFSKGNEFSLEDMSIGINDKVNDKVNETKYDSNFDFGRIDNDKEIELDDDDDDNDIDDGYDNDENDESDDDGFDF